MKLKTTTMAAAQTAYDNRMPDVYEGPTWYGCEDCGHEWSEEDHRGDRCPECGCEDGVSDITDDVMDRLEQEAADRRAEDRAEMRAFYRSYYD